MRLVDVSASLTHVAQSAQVRCFEGASCDTGLPKVNANSSNLQAGLQVVFGVVAVLAVFLIVVAGLRFVAADANPQEISKARRTIIYSLIGLVIALSGEAIVSFVLFRLS